MMLDLRAAVRALAKAPAFGAAVVLTLAVALGLVTTAVSLLVGSVSANGLGAGQDAVVLYMTERVDGRDVRMRWPYAAIVLARTRSTSFDQIASYTTATVNLSGAGSDSERVDIELASPEYLEILGVAPALGRPYAAAPDERIPGPDEILLSDRLWRLRFAATPDVIGRTVRVSGRPVTVVGVLPPGFRGLSGRADVLAPHSLAPVLTFSDYFTSAEYFHNVIASPRPGVSIDQARSELAVIVSGVADLVPFRSDRATARSADVRHLSDARRDPQTIRARVLIAVGAVFVLLIAAVNVGNLVVSRVTARSREFAMRLAIGATRARVFRAMAVEIGLVTCAGLSAALLIASWTRDVVASLVPAGLANPANDYGQLATLAAMELDTPVVLIASALAVLTMVLIGLLACRPVFAGTLSEIMGRGGPRGGTGPGRAQRLLLTTQVAVSIALLTSAALLFQTLSALGDIDPGFDATNVIAFSVAEDLAAQRPDSGVALADRMLAAVARVPGVLHATVGQCTPYGARCARLEFRREDAAVTDDGPAVGWHRVGPDHFAALDIPVLRGRGFTSADRIGRAPVVVINATAAKRLFADREPVGQRVRLPEVVPGEPDVAEIVGVVGDVVYWPPHESPGPDVYQPALQFSYPWTTVMVRTSRDPAASVAALREAIRHTDPNLPLFDIVTLQDLASVGRADRRFLSALIATCAGLGLLLAVIGVYAMTASWMTARRRELGLRVALGAEPRRLIGLVMGATLMQTVMGVAIGVVLALGAGRLLGAVLFGVEPHDIRTVLSAGTAMLAVSLVAAFVPARRALRLDPVRELNAE
jgi:putative ABC transport system permease protein